MTFKAIVPKRSGIPDLTRYATRRQKALERVAKLMEREYKKIDTTFSQKNKLDIESDIQEDAEGWKVTTTASSHFIRFLNDGTGRYGPEGRDFEISPRAGGVLIFQVGGKAKSKPRVLRSGQGRRGNTTIVTKNTVTVKGIKPREYDEVATETVEDKVHEILAKLVTNI